VPSYMMPPWFERRRAQQLADYDRDNRKMAEEMRRLGALYLFGTIGLEAVLKSDGTVFVAVDDAWDEPDRPPPPWRPATERERTASLVIARKRIPEVGELLPRRPAGATTCATCKGTGHIVEEVVCMDCGAMGWVAPAA